MLPQAVAALYNGATDAERHAADAWLRAFTSQDGAWRQLLELLANPTTDHNARFFAATALRPLCCRRKEVTEADAAPAVAQLLAQQFEDAAAAGIWHTANQLAASLATVALRTPAWPEQQLLPQVLALVQGPFGADGSSSSSSSSNSSSKSEQQKLTAQLHLMLALAEAACSRNVSMHPQRREAARAALAAAPELLSTVQQALALGDSSPAAVAALQLVQAWCSLGPPPAGAEAGQLLWQQLHLAALHPGLGSAAAEAVAALYATCCCPAEGGAGSAAGAGEQQQQQRRQAQRRCDVLAMLLGLLPGFASALQQALGHTHEAHAQAQLLCALTILGAAAAAADRPQDWGSAGPAAAAADAVQLAAEVALVALQQPLMDVTLAALQHFDEQLERWKEQQQQQQQQQQGHGIHGGACSPEQRQTVLGRLCGALLQRMTLPRRHFSADARDLPDELQQVRREAADTFRTAADVLGPEPARQQLLQLAAEAQAAWQGGGGWQQLECSLYALNLVWGRQRSQQLDEAAAAGEVHAASAAVAAALRADTPKLAGTALTLLGGIAEQLALLQGQPVLQQLLDLLVQLVQLTGDEKLSRNAATTCYRLAGCRPLAMALVAGHPGFSNALCGCFVAVGGMQQRAQQGEDLCTAQFLLRAICSLAAAAAESGGQAAAANGAELLLQLLRQPAGSAQAALAAAAAATADEQRQQQLKQAALHVETIAVALEAVSGGSNTGGRSSPLALQLPSLLSHFSSLLQQAAVAAVAAAQQEHPQLMQVVCRVAAAAAATPAASTSLELVQTFAAALPHPCVLLTLAELASSHVDSSSTLPLQAAISASIQAAAAQHAEEPDWQPAVLCLGTACLQRLPAAAADGPTLDALLAVAQHSMRSYHRDVCEHVLRFTVALCGIGTAVAASQPSATGPAPTNAAAVQHLRQLLDGGGLGAALVLQLLLAAAGSMPPYMVVQVADTLHCTWQATGDRFTAWFGDAVLAQAPDHAPWRRWKQEAQQSAVAELLGPQCARDARRFKRMLKVLCGGKKKGQHLDQPARVGS